MIKERYKDWISRRVDWCLKRRHGGKLLGAGALIGKCVDPEFTIASFTPNILHACP